MSRTQRIALGGLDFIPDLSGALYVPEFDTLIVADLHLEKASSIARRGVHLPPYDTRATLAQLALAIEASNPRRLIFLGDSFHDSDAGSRIARDDVERLGRIAQQSRSDLDHRQSRSGATRRALHAASPSMSCSARCCCVTRPVRSRRPA